VTNKSSHAGCSADLSNGERVYFYVQASSVEAARAKAKALYPGAFIFVGPLVARIA
jgi:hypothetical protein